jgi:hypothetical protein
VWASSRQASFQRRHAFSWKVIMDSIKRWHIKCGISNIDDISVSALVCTSNVYSLLWSGYGCITPAETVYSKEVPALYHHITSHHITSHHITSHHITSHHITYCMLYYTVRGAIASLLPYRTKSKRNYSVTVPGPVRVGK